jgi:hypothetical protein
MPDRCNDRMSHACLAAPMPTHRASHCLPCRATLRRALPRRDRPCLHRHAITLPRRAWTSLPGLDVPPSPRLPRLDCFAPQRLDMRTSTRRDSIASHKPCLDPPRHPRLHRLAASGHDWQSLTVEAVPALICLAGTDDAEQRTACLDPPNRPRQAEPCLPRLASSRRA